MIIVSQNKEEIVNFDNIANIYILQYTEDCSIMAPLISGGMVKLGLYPSLDRAKEVLENIVTFYSLADKTGCVQPLEALALAKVREHSIIYMPEK